MNLIIIIVNIILFIGYIGYIQKTQSIISITKSIGYTEGAFVEWTGPDSEEYSVYYSNGTNYIQIDSMLIRKYSDHFRADVLGLKSGSYTLKILSKSGEEKITSLLEVSSYDRSGFTFSSKSPIYGKGIGAYKDDGTLKPGTKILYVTEKTKASVTMEINGKTYVGVSNITQQIKDKNNCGPVAIRIIGQVTLEDLSCKDMSNAYAIGVKGASQVTFEGVGDDATLNAGIGVFQSKNVEIRNIGLMLWGGGKDGDGVSLKDTSGCWIHNNDFFYGLPGSEDDQKKGDGSMDLKDNSKYITISYNHFWDSGKTSLCGMKSESGPNYISYHHNWFDHSDSRHPRLRTMTIHVYNNYYDGNSNYGIGVTYGGEAFVENNYFRNCKYPMLISLQGSEKGGILSKENGGIIKAYGNIIIGGTSYITYDEDNSDFDAYEAKSRNEEVPSSVKAKSGGSTYSNFDIDDNIMYKYTPNDTEKIPFIVKRDAGRIFGGDFKFEFSSSDDESSDVNSNLMDKLKSYQTDVVIIGIGNYSSYTGEVEPYEDSNEEEEDEKTPITESVTHNFSEDGLNSNFFSIKGNLSPDKGEVVYNNLTLTICLKLESKTQISFTLSKDFKLTLITNASTKNFKLDGNKITTDSSGVTTIDISSGPHNITKADTGFLYMIIIS